jgi:hypothetical protein
MRLRLILFLFGVAVLNLSAQRDSIAFENAELGDRIYLSYGDFRQNKAVTKNVIVSNLDKNQQEFIAKVLFNETFSFKNADSILVTLDTKRVWGYRQNGTFYINFNGDFYRVPVFGSISYFVANVVIMNTGFYDPRFGVTMGPARTKELREFVMDFYEGEIREFTMENAKNMLSRDSVLYEEFKKLSRKKQKEQVYRYIRKYNERHPVYFLK